MSDIEIFGNNKKGKAFQESLKQKNFFFSLVISYSETCEIPGVTFAGSNTELIKYTPPADAEFLHYGYCKSTKQIPMTPDGKPTPALLSRVALKSANIPNMIINAGSKINPQLPYIHTGLPFGKNIMHGPAMTESVFAKAVKYGKIIGKSLSSMTDCLIIGESIPGGTTTALAVMRGLGIDAHVSSSMPKNPTQLKENIINNALQNLTSKNPFTIAATLGDPMIPVVAGMASAASKTSKVILAGGTQMAGVLSVGKFFDLDMNNIAIGTTSYIANDESANFLQTIQHIADIPILVIDPGLDKSKIDALRAYSQGFAKEGAGAGGSIIAAMLKTKTSTSRILELIEKEYTEIFI